MTAPMPREELLACPFCAGPAEYFLNPSRGDNSMARCRCCGAEAFGLKWSMRVPGNAQSPWPITDVMCEAAISADVADRIQGFSYEKRHVIRDVWMPPQEQELWSAPVAGPDEYQAFQRQCRIERMRRVIAAALWTLTQGVSK